MATKTGTDRWQARTTVAWLVRMTTVLVPVAAGVVTVALLSRWLPQAHGSAKLGRYGLVFGGSWVVLWLSQRALTRLLPLAVLLEMSLIFPERAPSRLKVARRANSATELARMAQSPSLGRKNETTQQAAERILTLVSSLARHDKRTRGHAERVRSYTDLIATRMGLPQTDRDRLRWAALLHDIGKLEVPSSLLNKPGKPTAAEWEVLRQHPQAGADIAAPLMDWLGVWGEVIVQHHEKFDGTGYPAGLAGRDIGLGGRIVAVADTFEVMTAARSYKRPVRKDLALKELVRCAGTQFDPAVVRALVEVPARRLMVLMGPSAWIAGLPFIGQAPAALSATITAQATVTLSAVTVAGVATLTPQAIAATPTPPAHSAPAQVSVPSDHVVRAHPSAVATTTRPVETPTPTTLPHLQALRHAASPSALPTASAASAPTAPQTPAPTSTPTVAAAVAPSGPQLNSANKAKTAPPVTPKSTPTATTPQTTPPAPAPSATHAAPTPPVNTSAPTPPTKKAEPSTVIPTPHKRPATKKRTLPPVVVPTPPPRAVPLPKPHTVPTVHGNGNGNGNGNGKTIKQNGPVTIFGPVHGVHGHGPR